MYSKSPALGIRFFSIKVTLLEENWSELYVLCAIQWSFSSSKPSLFQFDDFEMMSQEAVEMLKHLTNLFYKFYCFQVNPAEFACMKAIVLFRSGTNFCRLNRNNLVMSFLLFSDASGLKDKPQIENLQEQAILMLKSHVENSFPSNQTRFPKLLLLLANTRKSSSSMIEKTFFEKIIGNAKMEKLLCEMFQS